LCAACLGRALTWKPVPEGPQVYEPDRVSLLIAIFRDMQLKMPAFENRFTAS